MTKKDVSIILVNYKTRDVTRNCLKSIYEKTDASGFFNGFDIWVVDNDSKDGSVEMIKAEFPEVNLIENKENVGFGRANNMALEKTDAKYLLLLNTDTILVNNAIKILFDFMEKTTDAGACGGYLLDTNGEAMHSFGDLPSLKLYIFRHLGLSFLLKKKNPQRDEVQEVEQIIGADLMIRKSVLDETGAFDPAFFLYMEELELQYRINKKAKIYYVPEAKIIHLKGASSSNKWKRKQIIKKSEFIYYVLTNPNVSKTFLKILFTLTNLYTLFVTPKETLEFLRYIWTENE